MTRLRLAPARSRRRGFTLIELLVVISIIAVLLSLIAPAVQNARRAARRMECQSHMHNIAVAVQNFASTNDGGLPSLVGTITANAPGSPPLPADVTWVVPLLPLMDEAALYRTIRATDPVSGVATIPAYNIKVLTCPEDTNKNGVNNALSYAANAGYINRSLWGAAGYTHTLYTVDYDGSTAADVGDVPTALASGVFWRRCNNSATYVDSNSDPSVTIDSIANGDGSTHTIMFAENVNSSSWAVLDLRYHSFGIAVDPAPAVSSPPTAAFGSANVLWRAAWTTANAVPDDGTSVADEVFGGVTLGTVFYRTARINDNPSTGVGIPRPSSQHLGLVNAVFCDGSVRPLKDGMDTSVFARLVTPDGTTHGQPLVSGNAY